MNDIDDFTHEVRFEPGYDYRDDPHDQRGAHSVEIRFILRGPLGAIVGTVFSGWMTRPLAGPLSGPGPQARRNKPGVDSGVADVFPTGGAVSLHSPVQRRDYWVWTDDCDVLSGGCWNDAGYMIGDRFFEALVSGGSEAAWSFLRGLYDDWLHAQEEVSA